MSRLHACALSRRGLLFAFPGVSRCALFAVLPFALLAGAVLAPGAGAALPPLIPREVLFGNPERMDPQISPDGKRLAYLRPDSGDVMQVWVRTLGAQDDRPVTRDPKRGIMQYGWTWDGRTLFYLQDNGGDENYHVFLSDPENGETRDLTPILGVQATPLALEPERPDEMIVAMNRRDPALREPWKVDLRTGALTLLAENPGDVRTWIADTNLEIRGCIAGRPDGGAELRLRDGPSTAFHTALSWEGGDELLPEGFSRDGSVLHVRTNLGADTRGLYACEPSTGKLTLLASDPGADADQVLLDPKTGKPQAVSFERLRRQWTVLDSSIGADWDRIGRTSPGSFTIVNRDREDRTWVILFDSDVGSPRYYLWDRAAGRAGFLMSASKALDSSALAPMQPLEIKARDGLSLPSFLTLPAGIPARNLPLVLYVHGGPWARDSWGLVPDVQWLANRGYAVLQVNYRGSAGFGRNFLRAARHECAGKMHDDLIDGVDWAIREGIADPRRVGIMGASFGGYATLVGLSFTPDVFACGVDMVGPSNLVTLIESFPPYWKPFLAARWYPLVGDPSVPEDRAFLLERSPISRADRIKAPLLVGQGANDPRVKQEESDRIVAALKERGVPVEYIVFPDEGHGFQRPENRLRFYTAAEEFLARHLGGRAEPGAAAPENPENQED